MISHIDSVITLEPKTVLQWRNTLWPNTPFMNFTLSMGSGSTVQLTYLRLIIENLLNCSVLYCNRGGARPSWVGKWTSAQFFYYQLWLKKNWVHDLPRGQFLPKGKFFWRVVKKMKQNNFCSKAFLTTLRRLSNFFCCCATTRFGVIGSQSWNFPKIYDIQQP